MKLTRGRLMWIVVYVTVMAAGLAGLHAARQWALTELSNPQSQAEWETWRHETIEQEQGGGPVARRRATSPQPPTLVLLRDYYATCIALFLLLGSVLFLTLTFFIRGALSTKLKFPLPDDSSGC